MLTPPGTGAVGVVRLSGPDAAGILASAFRPRVDAFSRVPSDDRLVYGDFTDESGEIIDDVLVSRVGAGREPAFDVSAHGGVRVMQRILGTMECMGAPLANVFPSNVWPTKDLIDADAISALGEAKTGRAACFLAWQRLALSKYLEEVASWMRDDVERAAAELEALLARSVPACFLVRGATVVIAGPPNSGKSTLFNRLVGRTAAVVSPTAGTTRDWVSSPIELNGIPLTLMDTAGVHPTNDALEHQAIEGGRTKSSAADLILLVFDGSLPLSGARHVLLAAGFRDPRAVVLLNKADQHRSPQLAELFAERPETVRVSALTGDGIDILARRITARLGFVDWIDRRACLFCQRQVTITSDILAGLKVCPKEAARAIKTRLIGFGVDSMNRAELE